MNTHCALNLVNRSQKVARSPSSVVKSRGMKISRLAAFIIVLVVGLPYVSAAPESSTSRDSGLDRTLSAIARHQFNLQRLGNALTGLQPRALKDQGNVSVMQDDGSLIIPLNRFDLTNRSVTFSPRVDGYQVVTGAVAYDTAAGSLT